MPREELKALSDKNQRNGIEDIYYKCKKWAEEGYYVYETISLLEEQADTYINELKNSPLFKGATITKNLETLKLMCGSTEYVPRYTISIDWS